MRALEARAALITGASQGLGLAIARAYVQAGASVVLCARDRVLLERACREVAALASPRQTVLAHAADVSSAESVATLVSRAIAELPELDILVNNAGVQGPMGAIEDVDWQAWVHAVSTNLIGSVACCRWILPHMKALGRGKILQISGGGATAPVPRMSAYAASKAGVVRFVESLAHEVREHGIEVNAIAPGALNTRMLDEVIAAGPERVGRARYQRAVEQKASGGASIDRAAELAVFLASSACSGITGRLISAVWDPWAALPEHAAELDATDVYTLRRITPSDRGLDWDEP